MNQILNNHEADYHILNLNVSVESDSKELLNRFDQDYGWFRVPSLNGNKSLTFSIHVSSAKTPAVITTRSFNRDRGRSCRTCVELRDISLYQELPRWKRPW